MTGGYTFLRFCLPYSSSIRVCHYGCAPIAACSQRHLNIGIHPVERKKVLCQIDPDGSNLFHDFPSRLD